MTQQVDPIVLIGLVLSLFAALAAFLITYEEWSHHYLDEREPFRHAVEAAAVAFVVFAVLTILAATFASRLGFD